MAFKGFEVYLTFEKGDIRGIKVNIQISLTREKLLNGRLYI